MSGFHLDMCTLGVNSCVSVRIKLGSRSILQSVPQSVHVMSVESRGRPPTPEVPTSHPPPRRLRLH